jgi:ankyrin repeat protein
LTLASGLKQKPSRMLIALVNGGSIVDFRTKDGSTALHRAVVKNNAEALRYPILVPGSNTRHNRVVKICYITSSQFLLKIHQFK